MRRELNFLISSFTLLVILAGAGCSIGPRRLAPVRFDYNQAISRSFDQQLLLNLVRLRYPTINPCRKAVEPAEAG